MNRGQFADYDAPRDLIAEAIYAGGDGPEWRTTVDGTPNSASYEFADRVLSVMPMPEARLRVYWRVGSEKKFARRYGKGWTAQHLQWDPSGERVIVLWTRVITPELRKS